VKLATLVRTAVLVGALVACAAVPLAANAVNVENPINLNGAYVLDTTGTVAKDIPRIETALDSLFDQTGIGLFVVYVDTFTGADSAADWADLTAVNSGLGARDALLAIAIGDRQYQLSVADSFAVTETQLAEIEQEALVPRLRDDDWAGAAVALADGLREKVATGTDTSTDTPATTDAATPPGGESDAGGIPLWPILAVGGVAVGGGVLYRVLRKNRGERSKPTGELNQEQLDARAGSLLVDLDNALTTSEQELGFAVAQFGESATAEFTATLSSARAQVAEAFGLRQKLDDVVEDSPEQKREWTTRIIALCEQADAALDAQAESFDALRSLEVSAAEVIITVDAATTAASGRLSAARTAITGMTKAYSAGAVSTVTGNVDQATQLLALATSALAAGHSAIASGSASEAAVAVRSAQAATGQATGLLDAIGTLETHLTEATTQLNNAAAELRDDIAEATAAPPSEGSAELSRIAASAQSALDAATGSGALDPVSTLTRLHDNSASLAAALDGVREREAQIAKARTALDSAVINARSQIASGEQFLASRRGAVGTEARTRLSEASRNLNTAVQLAPNDPIAAVAAAQQASHLAEAGIRLAQADVDSFTTGDYSARSRGGGVGTGLGAGLGEAIIGGIIGGLLSGGGSSGAAWGSSGSFGGSSRIGGRSGSSRRSSSRGSSRSSGRRGGGGRF
jgi:hypothetical protein